MRPSDPWPLFLWVVLPYLALASFFLGHAWRYATDRYGWGSRSSQILERRILRWASPLFHYGILAVLAGHVAGILVPVGLYHRLGLPDEVYHAGAVTLGSLAGLATVVGLAGLLWRRWASRRVRRITTPADWLAEGLLFVTAASGLVMAIGQNLGLGPYDYRYSVGPWFRSLFVFRPDPSRMVGVPWPLQLHVGLSLLLLAIWPYTRLVHVWSAPVGYLTRAYIPFRARGRVVGGFVTRPRLRRELS